MTYYCENCNKYWNHEVKTCIFCGAETRMLNESVYRVLSSTKVHVPSKGNENVPYYVYLLEDKNGQKIIRKSDHQYEIGDEVSLDVAAVSRYAVGVIGSGLMGAQIAEYLVQTGYPVVLKTRSKESIDKITSKIQKKLSKKLQEQEVAQCLENLTITTDYSNLKDVDIVIEASKEDLEVKKEIFSELSGVCRSATIFATNSSSLCIDALAEVTDRPDRFIGLHFFNPIHRMDLVEVVIGTRTSDATQEFAITLAQDLKKQPIVVKNSPGFIVNRLLLPQINEAIRLLGDGIASKEDIDSAVKLGLNHPMGPFELADFIGLDTCLSILDVLHTGLGDDHFRPAPLLRDMVKQGKLGFKSGEGFYCY